MSIVSIKDVVVLKTVDVELESTTIHVDVGDKTGRNVRCAILSTIS
jgi:hypothetical protein